MPVQKEPEPTTPGIRSDASKRKVVFGSCRTLMASCRIGLDALAGSSPVLALMTPPSFTRLFAHSGLDRYFCTLTVSASLENAPTISPPPVIAVDPAVTGGSRNAHTFLSGPTVAFPFFGSWMNPSKKDAWWVMAHVPSPTTRATSPNGVELIDLTSPKPAFTYSGFFRIWPTESIAVLMAGSVNGILCDTHLS